MPMINCPHCGTPNPLGKTFCGNVRCAEELPLYAPVADLSGSAPPPPSAFGATSTATPNPNLSSANLGAVSIGSSPDEGAGASSVNSPFPANFGSPPWSLPSSSAAEATIPASAPSPNPSDLRGASNLPPQPFSVPISGAAASSTPLPPVVPVAVPAVRADEGIHENVARMSPPPQVAKVSQVPCPACKHPNAKADLKCSQCGQALVAACAKCGHQNRITAKYCSKCSEELATASGSGTVRAQVPPPAPGPISRTSMPPLPPPPSPVDSFSARDTAPYYSAPSLGPSPAATHRAFLVLLNRQKQELARLPIKDGDNLIGICEASDGIFPDLDLDSWDTDKVVSRRHAILHCSQGRLTLTDLSRNGVWVNQTRIPRGQPVDIDESSQLLLANLNAKVQWA